MTARRCLGILITTALLVSCGGAIALRGASASSAPGRGASPAPTAVVTGTPVPTPVAPVCTNQSKLALWSATRLAWQVIVVPAQLSSLTSVDAEVGAGAGGILLFGATAPADLARRLTILASDAPGGIAPLVMSDVEGGAVERASNLLGRLPSARQLAQTMTAPEITAYALSLGHRLRSIGITTDLAPVLDLDSGFGPTPVNPDGTRSFSADPHVAAIDAAAFSRGLSEAGVVAVAKHFPGLHGSGDNTDAGPAQTASWSDLQDHGLVPFETAIAAGQPAIMLSNASVPGLSSLPSSISPQVVGALRHQLGFRGLLLTDSLTAGALTKIGDTLPNAAVAAVSAGVDMVIYNGAAADVAANATGAVAAIVAALARGTLPRSQLIDQVGRVLAIKHVDLCGSGPA